MTKPIIVAWFFALLLALPLCHSENSKESIKFSITKPMGDEIKKYENHINIENVSILRSALIDDVAAKKITKSLHELSKELRAYAKSCHNKNWSGPWGYKSKLHNIYKVDGIVSIVFDTSAVCDGNIEINKIARSYSIVSGENIKPIDILGKFSPKIFQSGSTIKGNYVELNEKSVNILLRENRDKFTEYTKSFCKGYLTRISYAIWVEPGHLTLQPWFSHLESVCHEDYSIKFK